MLKSFKIYKIKSAGAYWEIPPALAKELDLKDKQPVTLTCGSLSVQARVITAGSADKAHNTMGLSRKALTSLKLPAGISLCIKPGKPGQFRLGPVIGVLTFPHVIELRKFTLYKHYANRMKQWGLLYVFGPQDIKKGSKTITGYVYNETDDTWQSGEFPYPDAVMDRRYPNNHSAHRKLEKVIGKNRIFNKKTQIDKMEFYKALKNEPLLQEFLPETGPLQQPSDLKYFLNKYGTAFLKPVGGMKGRGILYIINEDGGILCRYMDNKTPVSEKVSRPEDAFSILNRLNARQRPYIIQAGINRMECRGRAFSFRVMVLKDGSGNWTVPAIFAKITVPGGFLTNNSSGGEFILLRDLFKCVRNRLPYTETELCRQLKDISLRTAMVLDDEFGPLGKLGIDVVIDSSGKPWLIEANGNPGLLPKGAAREYPNWRSRSYDYHLSYALFLAGFRELSLIPCPR